MNIFDELAESYTYNGVVSLKALEDDIVTLENQIDSYGATLKELQLRGKKPGPLVQKIRDAKIRLSLLKATYKRESDRSASDDVILNMLGISANNANEVEAPDTAVEGREPLAQDFEQSEIEVVDDTVEDTESIENESECNEEVVVENTDTEEEKVVDDFVPEQEDESEVVEKEFPPVGIRFSPNKSDDIEAQPATVETPEDGDKHLGQTNETVFLGHKIEINEETGQVVINDNALTNPTEYFVPQEEEIDDITYPGEPIDNMAEVISVDDAVKVITDKPVECDYECPPPPGWEDYFEPVEGFEPLSYNPEYTEEVDVVHGQEELEIDDSKNVIEYDDVQMNEVAVDNEWSKPIDDFQTYEPFYKPFDEIYASFDLSSYTNMVNTDTVSGVFDNKRKILEITFHDIRDYSIFIKLMKQKKPGLFSFLEKPKSIFMDVHERHGNEEKIYHHEFVNCRLKYLLDSGYSPKSETVTTETEKHECTAVFKYKKLKLS